MCIHRLCPYRKQHASIRRDSTTNRAESSPCCSFYSKNTHTHTHSSSPLSVGSICFFFLLFHLFRLCVSFEPKLTLMSARVFTSIDCIAHVQCTIREREKHLRQPIGTQTQLYIISYTKNGCARDTTKESNMRR